jgi:predicted phage tail protein
VRLHHIVFGSALIAAAFTWAAPAAWDRHVAGLIVTAFLVGLGLMLATGSAVLDFLRPRRKQIRYSQREVDRAYRAGRNTGAALGPDDETRRRWRREGFEA